MSFLAKALGGRPVRPGQEVGTSPDFIRVASLPMRAPAPPCDAIIATLEARLARNPQAPTMHLRPIQAWALAECKANAAQGLGILCPMGVGSGKTLVSALVPSFYHGARTALFTYASLYEKTVRELSELRKHWKVPADIHIRTWESLSRPDASDMLAQLAPALVVADEVHAVKEPTTARTLRFLRFFEEHPHVPLVALSGTITTRGLADFAHIAALCLGNHAPVPLDPQVVADWGLALDTGVNWMARKAPGVLAAWMEPGEKGPREGFQRRLTHTHGVVATTADALGTALDIEVRRTPPGPALAEFVRHVEGTGMDPDGNELEDPAALARVVKTASAGYWLRWEWPNGAVDTEWLTARNGWARACRKFLTDGPSSAGLDSPALLAAACQAGKPPTWELGSAWEKWAPVRDRAAPPVVARFNRDAIQELGEFVTKWAKAGGGIVWVSGPDVGEALSSVTRLPHYPAGVDPSTSKAPAILASAQAHGVGKNLQRWARNLVLVPPSSGKNWEQLLGRTHRPGQASDTVEVTVCAWNDTLRKSWERARDEALYIQQTTGSPQKLRAATIIGD